MATGTVQSIGEDELIEVKGALSQNPHNVPYDYDRRLLSEGGPKLGRDLEQSEKLLIREKFKEIVKEHP